MIGRLLYLEFLIPVKDYLFTLKLKEFIFDWAIPVMLAILAYIFILKPATFTKETNDFAGQILSVLGVLLGFSIASVTLLLTSTSQTIEQLKNTLAEGRKIGGMPISVYQLTLITFNILLFAEISGTLINLMYGLVASVDTDFREASWKAFYAFDCFLITQVLALNIRNTTNMYMVFLKPPSRKRSKI